MKRLSKKPKFTTGMASTILEVPTKTLINYENSGLTNVKRTKTGRRAYSEEDLFRVRTIKYLLKNKNMKSSGVKYIIELRELLLKDKSIDLYRYILDQKRIDDFVESIK